MGEGVKTVEFKGFFVLPVCEGRFNMGLDVVKI
jgi:hypothetical protein